MKQWNETKQGIFLSHPQLSSSEDKMDGAEKLKFGQKLKPYSEKLFCIPSKMHFNLTELQEFEWCFTRMQYKLYKTLMDLWREDSANLMIRWESEAVLWIYSVLHLQMGFVKRLRLEDSCPLQISQCAEPKRSKKSLQGVLDSDLVEVDT